MELQCRYMARAQSWIKLVITSPSGVHSHANEVALRPCQHPSLLHDAYEGLVPSRANLVSHIPYLKASRTSYFCECGPFYQSKASYSHDRTGTSFKRESRHRPGCLSRKQSWQLTFRSVLIPIVGKAISATFSASRGTSGFSLSLMFIVANSVERSQSPAFQLFDDVYELRHKVFVEERETTAGFIFVEENEPTSGLVFGEKGQYYVWKWNIETLRECLEDMPLKLWALFTISLISKRLNFKRIKFVTGTIISRLGFLAAAAYLQPTHLPLTDNITRRNSERWRSYLNCYGKKASYSLLLILTLNFSYHGS